MLRAPSTLAVALPALALQRAWLVMQPSPAAAQPLAAAAVLALSQAFASKGPQPRPVMPWDRKQPRAQRQSKVARAFEERLLERLGGLSETAASGGGSAAAAAPAAAAGGGAASSSPQPSPGAAAAEGKPSPGVASWLKSLVPDALRSKKQQQEAREARQGEVDAQMREQSRNVRIAQYVTYVRSNRSGVERPIPRLTRFRGDLDAVRMQWHRYRQHEAICEALLDEEVWQWENNGQAALADTHALLDIANRTGYTSAMVRECLASFLDLKDSANLLADYEAQGKSTPRRQRDALAVVKQLRQDRHEARVRELLLARRSRDNCPLRPHLALLGRSARCPNTQLPYSQCCGTRR